MNSWVKPPRPLGSWRGRPISLALASAADDAGKSAPYAETARKLTERGIAFLRPRQDAKGGWSTQREPGITALVVTALLRSGQVAPGEPIVTKALSYLESFIGPKGGLSEAPHANYSTSIAIVAFKEANVNGRYQAIIKAGRDFLKTMQWDESEGKGRDDAFYGGAGYGGTNSRPDLSNTAFFIEALRESGLPADDPNLQKAIVFVSRCQNLKSEFNDQAWATKINDGGFVYTAANGGQSMAGPADGGGLRSYASMTYAGLKSMIYAGLTRDDPRVKAALKYISRHYTLDENPGLGQQGLYYYYHTFAKTMAVLGEPSVQGRSGSLPRLEGRARDRSGKAAATPRGLGQPRRSLHGGRPQPRDGLRSPGPGVYTGEGVGSRTVCRFNSDHPARWHNPAQGRRRRTGTSSGLPAGQLPLDAEPHLVQLVAGVRRMGPRPVDGVVIEPRNDVPVAMIDGLAGGATVVDNHVESVSAGRSGDGPAQPGQAALRSKRRPTREARSGSMVRLGYEQRVSVADRIDVKKRHGVRRIQEHEPTECVRERSCRKHSADRAVLGSRQSTPHEPLRSIKNCAARRRPPVLPGP